MEGRLDLGTHLRKALRVVALAGDALADRFVQLGGQPLAVLECSARLCGLLGKTVRIVGQCLVELAAGVFGLGALVAAARKFALHLCLLAFQRIDALATLAATLRLQIGQPLLVIVQRGAALAFLTGQPLIVHVQFVQARIQQGEPALLAVRIDAELQLLQLPTLTPHQLQVVVMRARWQQRFDLPARGNHRPMGAIELGKVAHQPLGGVEGLGLFEHEPAKEHIEIAEIFCRLGLVQQPQCHLVGDAQLMAEALGVAGKILEMCNVIAQPRLELAQIQIEAGQLAGDIEAAFDHHVVLAHVGCGRAVAGDPEQPHQADHPPLTVAVLQHQCAPGGALAQILRGDFA